MALIVGNFFTWDPLPPFGLVVMPIRTYARDDGLAGYAQGFADGVASVVTDPDSPVVTIVSPTPGVEPGQPGGFPASYSAARATPIIIRITDLVPGIGFALLVAVHPSWPGEVVVLRRGAFKWPFDVGSTLEVIDPTTIEVTLYHRDGWPPGDGLGFYADAIDEVGNINP